MLSEALNDAQWGQCLLKPRLGGIGIIDIVNTVPGAYYASILSCLPTISKVDEAQKLGLNASAFDSSGLLLPSNQYGNVISALHRQVTLVYDEAMEIDRDLSLHVLVPAYRARPKARGNHPAGQRRACQGSQRPCCCPVAPTQRSHG